MKEHDGEKKFRKLPGYKIQNAYKINTFKIAYIITGDL